MNDTNLAVNKMIVNEDGIIIPLFDDFTIKYMWDNNKKSPKWFVQLLQQQHPIIQEIKLRDDPYVADEAFLKTLRKNLIGLLPETIDKLVKAIERAVITKLSRGYITQYKAKLRLRACGGVESDSDFITVNDSGTTIFDRAGLASFLTDKYNARIVIDKKYMFVYDHTNKFYSIDYGSTIETDLVNMFGNAMTTFELREIMSQVWHTKDRHVSEDTLHWKNDTLINFQNCVLDIETMKTYDHDPDKYFFKNIIKHEYDPDAKCPNILELLKRVFVTDIEVENQLEWIGFTLSPGYKFKAINIYVGESDTGKSTVFNIIIFMVGENNKCSVAPQEIKEPYNIDRYHGRMVNIAPDIGNDKIKNFNLLRILSGGDPVSGRAIYGAPYEFINSAKIMISCNDMPQFDGIQASYNRVNIIHCDTVFTKADIKAFDMDLYINENEISGLINEGIRAYKNTMERGGFITLNSEDTADKHDFMVNGLDNWAFDELNWCNTDNGATWMLELENNYLNWCTRNNYNPDAKGRVFTRKFREHFRTIKYTKEKRLMKDGVQRVKVFGVRPVVKRHKVIEPNTID